MNWHQKHTKRVGVINKILKDDTQLQQQDANYNCAAATIQNLCRILGKEMPAQEKLKESLGTTADMGTSPEAITKVLAQMGIPPIQFMADESLDDELSKGRVILAEFQDYQGFNDPQDVKVSQSSHFALIVGFDDMFYYCVDSFLPKIADTSSCIKKIPKTKFYQDWHARSFDGSHIKKHWGIIVQI